MARIAFFETHNFERTVFDKVNQDFGHDITFMEPRLALETAELAKNHNVVCSFVNDKVDRATLGRLKELGVKLLALRSAGFNHVDIEAAKDLGMPLVRVPAYSPNAVAEYAVGLLLTLNRKIHKAYNRLHELNFSLDGLVGSNLSGKTVGVIGTGKIGSQFAKIMLGFGCHVLAYDVVQNPHISHQPNLEYTELEDLYRRSDIISLHVPLSEESRHLINEETLDLMKQGVFLINTGRGGLIDTKALIRALKSRRIGGACLDVYEEEEGVFFNNLSEEILEDDVLARLLTFPNVLVTSHQGFLTKEALSEIAKTTLQNVSDFESNRELVNLVFPWNRSRPNQGGLKSA